MVEANHVLKADIINATQSSFVSVVDAHEKEINEIQEQLKILASQSNKLAMDLYKFNRINTRRLHKLEYNDIIFFKETNPNKATYKPGMLFPLWGRYWKVYKVIYHPRKWWQFWKRRKVFGYQLMYIGERIL